MNHQSEKQTSEISPLPLRPVKSVHWSAEVEFNEKLTPKEKNEQIKKMLKEAWQLHQRKEYQQAIELCDQIISLAASPAYTQGRGTAYVLRGNSKKASGDPYGGVKDCEEGIKTWRTAARWVTNEPAFNEQFMRR